MFLYSYDIGNQNQADGDCSPVSDWRIMPNRTMSRISPAVSNKEVVPYIQSLGIVTQGWYPFGGRGHTADLVGDPVISAIAEAHGVTSAQVILRWNLQRGVVVIPAHPPASGDGAVKVLNFRIVYF